MSVMREEIAIGRVSLDAVGGTRPWPVYWGAVWVGALSAVALVLVFGLLGIALGAYSGVPVRGYPMGREFGLGAMFMSVLGAFLAFAVGGWVAGKIVGAGPAEKTMLHAAIAWLVAVPFLLGFAALGSGVYFGTWYSGLAGVPTWVATAPGVVITPEAARLARAAATGALCALLLSLVGAVIGGWMASGEPMTLTHYRTRDRARPYPATV
jgi:hypothetical protein